MPKPKLCSYPEHQDKCYFGDGRHCKSDHGEPCIYKYVKDYQKRKEGGMKITDYPKITYERTPDGEIRQILVPYSPPPLPTKERVGDWQEFFNKKIESLAKDCALELNRWIDWKTKNTWSIITIYKAYERFGSLLRFAVEYHLHHIKDQYYVWQCMFDDHAVDKAWLDFTKYNEMLEETTLDSMVYTIPYTFRFNKGNMGLSLKTEIILKRVCKKIPHKFEASLYKIKERVDEKK